MNYPISIEIITPEIAQNILQRSQEAGFENRSLSKSLVHKFVKDMLDGRWLFNPQTIIISDEGCLLDGNHRLHALIKAKKSLPFYVVRNVSKEIFKVLDIGKKRTTGDLLYMAGIKKYSKAITAGCKYLYLILKTNSLGPFNGETKFNISFDDIYFIASKCQQEMEKAMAYYKNKKIRTISQTNNIALYVIFSFINKEKSNLFFYEVMSGDGIKKGDATFALRNFLLESRASIYHKIKIEIESKYIIHAWNKFYKNQPILQLKPSKIETLDDILGFNLKNFIQWLNPDQMTL